jgi:hypothetical protein
MSIRPIETQMMLARTAGLSKDSAAELKKGELKSDYLAFQQKAEEKEDMNRVPKTVQSERVELHLDERRDAKNERGGSLKKFPRKPGGASDADGDEELFPSDSTIDIKA